MNRDGLEKIGRIAAPILRPVQGSSNPLLVELLDLRGCKCLMFEGMPFMYGSEQLTEADAVEFVTMALYCNVGFEATWEERIYRAQVLLHRATFAVLSSDEWDENEAQRFNETGFCQKLTDHFFEACEAEEEKHGVPHGKLPLTQSEYEARYSKDN